MAIDQIHDVQNVYRKILHSMSRPGTISNLESLISEVNVKLPCYPAVFLAAVTLLDAEVTFHVIGGQDKSRELSELLSSYTMARGAAVDQADFLIVLENASSAEVEEALQYAKNGNLVDPQNSSTWIIESSILTNHTNFTLKGPGINGVQPLHTGLNETFWQKRNEKVKEYPLGIDLIMADTIGQIACIPRTTSIMNPEVM